MFRRFRVTSPLPNLLLPKPTSLSALNRPRFLPSFSRYFSSSSPAMSASPMKEVLLIGYGAVGAIYAFVLQKSGRARVTAVARSNFDVINKQGTNIRSLRYGDIDGWRPDRVCSSVSQALDRPYDYVVITTKSVPEMMRAPTLLAPFLSDSYFKTNPQPTYLFLQNGLNVEKDMYNAIVAKGGIPKIISTALWIGTNMFNDNVVEHSHHERLTMGVYRPNDFTATSNTESEQALLSDFADLLNEGGSVTTIVPEVQRIKFAKNFWNVCFSSVCTLTRYPAQAMFRLPSPPSPSSPGSDSTHAHDHPPSVLQASLIPQYTHPLFHSILTELLSVGHALGFSTTDLPPSLVESTIENTKKLHERPESKHVPSMLLDVQMGRPIEVEVIVGEVVRMARERKVEIPRIEMLYGMLLVLQNQLLQGVEARHASKA